MYHNVSFCILIYWNVAPCIEIASQCIEIRFEKPSSFYIFGMILEENLDTSSVSKWVSKFTSHIEIILKSILINS